MVSGLKAGFINVKTLKTQMLKNYVNLCATRIQKVFKGFFTRKVVVPVVKVFSEGRDEILRSVIVGWRIRRIMKTKEIENYIS